MLYHEYNVLIHLSLKWTFLSTTGWIKEAWDNLNDKLLHYFIFILIAHKQDTFVIMKKKKENYLNWNCNIGQKKIFSSKRSVLTGPLAYLDTQIKEWTFTNLPNKNTYTLLNMEKTLTIPVMIYLQQFQQPTKILQIAFRPL